MDDSTPFPGKKGTEVISSIKFHCMQGSAVPQDTPAHFRSNTWLITTRLISKYKYNYYTKLLCQVWLETYTVTLDYFVSIREKAVEKKYTSRWSLKKWVGCPWRINVLFYLGHNLPATI